MLNGLRTIFLLSVLAAIFMAVGFAVGGWSGLLMALVFSVGTNAFAYWNADKFVLRLQNAEAIAPQRAPDLYEMVARLVENAGLPMPKLYLIHADQPNAFATGRNPDHAAVAVSTGLLDQLEYDEVEAVIAHELAHIRNRDTLTMTMGATLAGAISVMAQFGLFFGSRNANSPFGGLGTIVMVIAAPFLAMITQMAVSRVREYEADKGGAEISGKPLALASALQKISRATKQFENPFARRHPGVAHMYIINPLNGRTADNLFSTHPDVRNRIAALEKIAQERAGIDWMSGRDRVVQDRISEYLPKHRVRRVDANEPSWRVPSLHKNRPENAPKGPWG